MKELVGNARNDFFAVDTDDRLIPNAEIILMVSQPVFAFAPGGGLNRTRDMSEFRFCAKPKDLRGLAEFLVSAADDLDEMSAKIDEAMSKVVAAKVSS